MSAYIGLHRRVEVQPICVRTDFVASGLRILLEEAVVHSVCCRKCAEHRFPVWKLCYTLCERKPFSVVNDSLYLPLRYLNVT